MRPSGPPFNVPWNLRDVLGGAAAALALFMLVQVGIGTVLADADVSTAMALLISAAFYVVLMGIATWFGPRRRAPWWHLLGGSMPSPPVLVGWAVLALVTIALLTFLYSLIAGLVSEDLVPTPLPTGFDRDEAFWLGLFVVVVVGPLAEEVFFRGFLFAGLVRSQGFWGAAVLSSIVFAASHLAIAVLVPAFLAGMVLAAIYRRTGSVWPAILAHATQNAIAFGLAE